MTHTIPIDPQQAAPLGDVRLSPDALVAMLVDAYEAGRANRPLDDASRFATTPRVARAGGGRRG
jgi:hypothetical protein